MKKTLLFIVMLIITSAIFAQAPQAINYQAVARDANGNLIANQDISFRLSILQGGPLGTLVYSESHVETSDQFGMVTLEIGRGTAISGVFTDISWGTDSYYLKTEMDPTGGTSYQEMGTSQFLSVPYAFWADTTRYALGSGQTCGMDICYDNHVPGTGAGRIIFADKGPVEIRVPFGFWNCGIHSEIFDPLNAFNSITAKSCGKGMAGYFFTNGTGHALKADLNSVFSTSNAFYAVANGDGAAGYFENSNAVGPGSGGHAIYAKVTNGGNPSNAIYAETNGTGDAGYFENSNVNSGRAILGQIINAANDYSAISGKTNGGGFGVFGLSGAEIPAGDGAAVVAGVGGESILRPGVAGYSRDSDGVHGGTRRTGTYYDDGNPTTIDAGIHGEPALTVDTEDGDNFGVVGTQSNYNSTGVLGIGGAKGHGVVGIPGGHEGFTTAGIRGFTRETDPGFPAWPPSYFPLKPVENKEQIGVFGQAWNFTGVWGESRYKFGVIGTAGVFQTLGAIIAGLPALQSAGIYGYASEDGRIGVIGRSIAVGPTISSGVRAIGNGAAESAAALTLDNGAVRVAGNSRAAGKVTTGNNWINDPWSRPGGNGHTHQTGYYTNITINNDLIIPGSFIQLTVEKITSCLYCHYFAHIDQIGTGFVNVVVTCVGDTQPPGPVYVHYWIVNPEPE
jgi:hypothetical protein